MEAVELPVGVQKPLFSFFGFMVGGEVQVKKKGAGLVGGGVEGEGFFPVGFGEGVLSLLVGPEAVGDPVVGVEAV
jgi:hypothetical protein